MSEPINLQIAREWVDHQITIERLQRRITELLVANNNEVERRRAAEAQVRSSHAAVDAAIEQIARHFEGVAKDAGADRSWIAHAIRKFIGRSNGREAAHG